MDGHGSDRVSSLRQRDRSPERDRLHVRFEESRGSSNEQRTSDDSSENLQDQESRSSSRKQYSLKLQRDNSDSENERKKLGSAVRESSDDNKQLQSSSETGKVDAIALHNRRLPTRPVSNGQSDNNRIILSTEEKNDITSDSSARDDTNDEDDKKDKHQDALDDAEMSSDDFNEKLASLDENSRKYYHFFHVCFDEVFFNGVYFKIYYYLFS